MLNDYPELICAEDLPASGDCIENASLSAVEEAVAEANYIIYRMSGGRVFGIRAATVRPAVRSGLSTCQELSFVRLAEPMRRVLWVMLDGALLPPTAYRVVDRNKLIRTDGQNWPAWQDLTKDLSEPKTFAVRYEFGTPVDAVTKRAAIDTAVELLKLAQPDPGQRRMPANVTSTRASGVSLAMQDRNQLIRELGSYLESVNRFMALHNPQAELQTAVYSPDTSPRLHVLDRNG